MKIKLLSHFVSCRLRCFLPPTDPEPGQESACAIHQHVLTVDTHCDTPFILLEKDWDIGNTINRGSAAAAARTCRA